MKFRDLIGGGGEIEHLGRESDWLQAPLKLACGRRDGRYFARVMPADRGP